VLRAHSIESRISRLFLYFLLYVWDRTQLSLEFGLEQPVTYEDTEYPVFDPPTSSREWVSSIGPMPHETGGSPMNKFDPKTTAAMRSVFEEVCSHIPVNSTEARSFIATKIVECASKGQQSPELLLDAGRRAVIDQFGTVDALRVAFALTKGGAR